MSVKALPIVTLIRLVQPWNAEPPMLVTLSGIMTLVRRVQTRNVLYPMLVTGRPSIVSGIVTAPPWPVYPVMVIVPLFVV